MEFLRVGEKRIFKKTSDSGNLIFKDMSKTLKVLKNNEVEQNNPKPLIVLPRKMGKSESHFALHFLVRNCTSIKTPYSLKEEPENGFLWCPQISLSLGKNEL